MRILLFANNWGGWQVSRWLREQGEEIVGLVVHPPENRKFTDEILDAVGLPEHLVCDASRLREPEMVEFLRSLRPDLGISAFFAYILKPAVIEIPRLGCINLHPAYLPRNRGWHPNVWPILDGSPAGVAVHYVDAGVDTGDVIARRRVAVCPTDTGATLHQKLTRELVELFKATWPSIKAGTSPRIPQDPAEASFHVKKDMDRLDRIDLNRDYRARDLINLLRGRTYPPYPAAYFVEDGKRIYARVQLFTDEALQADAVPTWDEK